MSLFTSLAGLTRSGSFVDSGTMWATALGTENSNGAAHSGPRASDFKGHKVDFKKMGSIFEQTQFKLQVGRQREGQLILYL